MNIFQGISVPTPWIISVRKTRRSLSDGGLSSILARSMVIPLKLSSSLGRLFSSHAGVSRTGSVGRNGDFSVSWFGPLPPTMLMDPFFLGSNRFWLSFAAMFPDLDSQHRQNANNNNNNNHQQLKQNINFLFALAPKKNRRKTTHFYPHSTVHWLTLAGSCWRRYNLYATFTIDDTAWAL